VLFKTEVQSIFVLQTINILEKVSRKLRDQLRFWREMIAQATRGIGNVAIASKIIMNGQKSAISKKLSDATLQFRSQTPIDANNDFRNSASETKEDRSLFIGRCNDQKGETRG